MSDDVDAPPPPVAQTIAPFTVREVYKAGWLKRTPSSADRRGGPFGKKHERLWAIFCIHDDVQPFLEFYSEPKASTSHQPLWAACMVQCMHISPSIAVHGEIFEFVITCRESAVLRLGAVTREQMNEWVDVLRNRLRDIGVLEPKENLYSPMPESAKPLGISTRDPNSPLPRPPDNNNELEHVTVISVNDDDTAFGDNVPVSPIFSTRVRIASAPEENRYEAIFNRPNRNLPQPQEHVNVVRTSSHQHHYRSRDGLRRTASVGQEHQRPLFPPLLVPGHPVLLPRPPLFVPAPPPLNSRHSSPLFRPTPHPNGALQPVTANHGVSESGFSLKERQVARLRMEMQHPAGVRIILKKKDCLNTIALVDALGAVWVGGWRQKEKPLLYNVFHIGDQIIRVDHCNISSSADVHRHIKNEIAGQVEFIVRRMPFGRVFHLRRDAEGQSLGIVTEAGGGAEIREVVPGGLAAQQGVPPLAISPLSQPASSASSAPMPCTWTLTEINGRPLNLCSKEGEARDRLNAVGKAVSVLIQPSDFVKLIKKQLKSTRGYKDYLLG